MKPKLIIGIHGLKGSGKSTLARILQKEIPNSYIITFAGALTVSLAEFIKIGPIDQEGLSPAWTNNQKSYKMTDGPYTGMTIGRAMQVHGQHVRDHNEDYWVDQLKSIIDDILTDDYVLIIPDVRYENEAMFVKNNGGYMIKITRDPKEMQDGRDPNHKSETSLKHFHAYNYYVASPQEEGVSVAKSIMEREGGSPSIIAQNFSPSNTTMTPIEPPVWPGNFTPMPPEETKGMLRKKLLDMNTGMNLNSLRDSIHQANKEKGFWEGERNTGELLMLVVSELSEALEALRHERTAEAYKDTQVMSFVTVFQALIKDTFEDEIADAIIRLFDLAGGLGIDIDNHIAMKLAYNSTRPAKHGKKF